MSILLRWLPDDSALRRAELDGHTYTMETALLWNISAQLDRLNILNSAQITKETAKKIKFPKWPKFPWSKREDDRTHVMGSVAKQDRRKAIEYLAQLSAGG